MHHVQRLHDGGTGVALAGRVAAGVGPTEGVEEFAADFKIPRLERTRAWPCGGEAFGHAGDITHGIE